MGVAQNELNVLIDGEDKLSDKLKAIESAVIRSVGAISSAIAGIKFAASPIESAGNFERELANVKKTTNFTTQEISKLNDAILDLSLHIDVSAIDLAKIAAAAGQQGLGTEGVAGIVLFTDSVARMASVLDITAEQAARDVGKILNIFKIPITDVEKVSSAFNQVSNNSTARGKELLDVVKRIGDLAGTINLQSSIGLAATGIDLGLNPEVIGTSFTKIFSQFRTKAKDFTKLFSQDLGQNVGAAFEKALNDKDGIGALKLFLDNLRKQTASEQAKSIALLSGTGRIFGLQTKLTQDVLNKILDKNIANSQEGFATGLSSIREQSTVLNTLNAQLTILKNSFFKLAADGATPLLAGLREQAIDLSKALQTDGVQSFVRGVATAFGQLFGVIGKVAGFIGGLNVNFNNFIVIAKVFVGLKLAETFAAAGASLVKGIAANIPGATAALATLGNLTKTNSQIATDAALKKKLEDEGQLATYKKLIAARKEQAAADLAAKNAQNVVVAERAGLNLANAHVDNKDRILQVVAPKARIAASDAGSAAATALALETKLQADLAAKVAAQQALAIEREAAHQANLANIRKGFQGERSIAAAAARAELEAIETSTFARTAQRAATTNATLNAKAELAASQQIAIAAQKASRLQSIAEREAASLLIAQNEYNAASAIAAEKAAALKVATANAGATAEKAATGFGVLRLAIGTIGTAIKGLIGLLGPIVIGLTIVYTLLDAFGLLDKIGPIFTSITDAIGLTSNAQRKAADEVDKLTRAVNKQKLELIETAEALDRYRDKTGNIDSKEVDKTINKVALNTDLDSRQKGAAEVAGLVDGAAAVKEDRSGEELRRTTAAKALASQLETVNKQLNEANKQYALFNQLSNLPGETQNGALVNTEKAKQAVTELTAQLEELKVQNIAFTASAADAAARVTAQATKDYEQIASSITGFFTDASLAITAQFLIPLNFALDEAKDAAKKYQDALKIDVTTDPGKEKARKETIEKAKAELDSLKNKIEELKKAFNDARDQKVKVTVDPAGIRALQELDNFLAKLSGRQVTNLVVAANVAVQNGAVLKGDKVGETKPAPLSTGSNKGLPDKKGESEAEKLAKAERDLAKAQAAAIAALKKEQATEFLAADQFYYAQGLVALETYYANRKRLELQSLAAERTAKLADIAALRVEQGKVKAPSKKKEIEAQIVKDQSAVDIINSKIADVPKVISRELELGKLKRADDSAGDAALIGAFFGVKDPERALANELRVLEGQFRVKLAALKENLNQKGSGITQENIDDLKAKNVIEGVNKVFGEVARSTNLAENAAQRYSDRLGVLRGQGNIGHSLRPIPARKCSGRAAPRLPPRPVPRLRPKSPARGPARHPAGAGKSPCAESRRGG